MPFLSLSLYNFRNLKNDNINLNFKEVFFVGENGQGKSNLLEALYYSAYGSSFRTHSDSQIIKNLQQNFSLISMYSNEKESLQRIKIIYDKKNQSKKMEKKFMTEKNSLIQFHALFFVTEIWNLQPANLNVEDFLSIRL